MHYKLKNKDTPHEKDSRCTGLGRPPGADAQCVQRQYDRGKHRRRSIAERAGPNADTRATVKCIRSTTARKTFMPADQRSPHTRTISEISRSAVATGPQTPPGQGSLFFAAPTQGTIYYCLTGSGFGRAAFESNNGTATAACAPLGASPTGLWSASRPARLRRQRSVPCRRLNAVPQAPRTTVDGLLARSHGDDPSSSRSSAARSLTGSALKTSKPTFRRSSYRPGRTARSPTVRQSLERSGDHERQRHIGDRRRRRDDHVLFPFG